MIWFTEQKNKNTIHGIIYKLTTMSIGLNEAGIFEPVGYKDWGLIIQEND